MSDAAPDLDALFLAALEITAPVGRAAFLDQSCRNHPALRAELERMLASHGELGAFLEHPVADFPAVILTDADRPDRSQGDRPPHTVRPTVAPPGSSDNVIVPGTPPLGPEDEYLPRTADRVDPVP
jgi:hypothetical protein